MAPGIDSFDTGAAVYDATTTFTGSGKVYGEIEYERCYHTSESKPIPISLGRTANIDDLLEHGME